jgi:dTDP-6-deoxy-L-talose 4-dehydrogenase (NAD+)
MSKLVLVTGAGGFVGRHVLHVLSERRIPVRAVVRESRVESPENANPIEDIRTTPNLFAENADWWTSVCKDVDTVIHLAWYVEPSTYLHSDKNLECLIGTIDLAKGAAQAGVRRFVGIGTCFEYDLDEGRLSVNTPLRPLTPYGAAKAATFLVLSQWLPPRHVEFCWCRLFYLYGEGEKQDRFVPYLRKKLALGEPAKLTSGQQVRDYLDVRDAAHMIVDAALGEERGPVNICSGEPKTIRQFAEQIADEYGRRDLLRFGARPDNPIDPPVILGIRAKR